MSETVANEGLSLRMLLKRVEELEKDVDKARRVANGSRERVRRLEMWAGHSRRKTKIDRRMDELERAHSALCDIFETEFPKYSRDAQSD